MHKLEQKNVEDWEDKRVNAYLSLRLPKEDDYEAHRPVLVPANDNKPGSSWIEYDAAGAMVRVVKARAQNPLRCDTGFRLQAPPPVHVPLTSATLSRHRLEAWRRAAPANDSDIFERAPRNKGGHDLETYTAELGWWRTMTNTPSNFDVLAREAANDDDEAVAGVECENEEIRPSLFELMRSLPPIQRAAVRCIRRSTGWGKTSRRLHYSGTEWHNGRVARFGGLKFSTVTKWAPDEVDPDDASANQPTNVSGPVSRMPRAGTLLAFRPSGRKGWSLPTEHAREHRGSQGDRNSAYLFLLSEQPVKPTEPTKKRQQTNPILAAAWLAKQGYGKFSVDASFRSWLRMQDFAPMTRHHVGLPHAPARLKDLFLSGRTTPGAGAKDGSGHFDRVRRQDEIDGQHAISVTEEIDILAGFRAAHANRATILDAAMTAKNMSEIAQAAGASSPHTGKRLLAEACDALRDYQKNYTAGLQNLPSRAA